MDKTYWVSCSAPEDTTFVVTDAKDIPKYLAQGYKEVITQEEYWRRWNEDYKEDLANYDAYYEYPYDEYPEEDLTP